MGSPSESSKLVTVLAEASAQYAKENPKSAKINKESLSSLSGGTTRNVLHFNPFPLVLSSGDGPYLTDVDGHEYLDLCAEYSAGMFGHSHPSITSAMHSAISSGYALGGVNIYEGRLAHHFTSRFPSISKIRFSNSGTEAVQTALMLAKAYTAKSTIIVFKGGYHGGLATFLTDSVSGEKTMNTPHKFIIVPYNDVPALTTTVETHKSDLAAILLEPMQGSAGCIPGTLPFLQATRSLASSASAVLIFDEVMTSRMSASGLQGLLNITPDLTILGKYFGGGGLNFAAFGGNDEIMSLIEPGHPNGVYHSGTYNNNVITMATASTVLEKLWTPDAASRLFDLGDWLRDSLTRLSKSNNANLQVTGMGSLMNIHFLPKDLNAEVVRSAEDIKRGDMVLRELFFFDMLRKGYFLARRGMISLMTVHTKEQLQGFVDAVGEFLQQRRVFVC
ncbi:MAG: hypothetical protein M1834_003339 [Cirrosporium novae-zelandiae]|nr:MAG: hypothetical protein M1834_003339 [Cirrosporium novae-zelandiae]